MTFSPENPNNEEVCAIKTKIRIFLSWCVFLAVLAGALYLIEKPPVNVGGDITVIFMQTQNDADSTLLCQQGAAILIDTGEECDSPHIIETLKSHGVEKLDYLILSHPDADHIGGAAAIVGQFPVECVIQPYFTEPNERLAKLNSLLASKRIPILYPTHTRHLRAGGIRFLVYPPLEKHYNDSNNYSLALLVQHEQVNMLFAGDAMRKRSDELLCIDWPPIDIYKVAHHGRANKSSKALFDAIHPSYAVVTAKSADQAILDCAAECETPLYYTAEKDCVFVSDGKTLTPQ